MSKIGEVGRRFVPVLIDSYAKNEPDKTWAFEPVDEAEISLGFRPITYRHLANAVNHAVSWLKKNLPDNKATFETIAYTGPKDIRYQILAIAALKCQKQLLLCSTTATPEIQAHLVQLAQCSSYLHAASMADMVRAVNAYITSANENAPRTIQIPELSDWMREEQAPDHPYTKTWAEGSRDPWLVFHTSGSTGLPKLIPFPVQAAFVFDAADLMSDLSPGQLSTNDLTRNRRVYVAIPALHFVGMAVSLQWTTCLGTELVLGPGTPSSAKETIQILQASNAEGALLPPSIIAGICREAGGLATLRKLDFIFFPGAPLHRSVAEQLAGHCKLLPAMGSTEAGPLFTHVGGDLDEWEYYHFREPNGLEFVPRSDELYELVIRRKPEFERWQQYFLIYPDKHEYETKDLFAPHPTKPGRWKYAGRLDDMIILDSGKNLDPSGIEEVVQQHPDVRFAIVGGEGRPRPFLLVDLVDASQAESGDRSKLLESIWPYIERANAKQTEVFHIKPELVQFTDPARPLPLTAKQTVVRKKALGLYEADVARFCAP